MTSATNPDSCISLLALACCYKPSVQQIIHQSLNILQNVVLHLTAVILFLGRKPEEEGVEDNGLEENSRDGQVSGIITAVTKNVCPVTCNKYTFSLFLSVGGH